MRAARVRTSGAVAQLGERRPCKAEVVGSSPISSTIRRGVRWRQLAATGGDRSAGFFQDVERSGMRGALALAGVRTMPWHRGSQHDLLFLTRGATASA